MIPDSLEFTAILSRVPKWHILTPEDKTETNDEWFYAPRARWEPIPIGYIGHAVKLLGQEEWMCRREIPEHVCRSMAWWSLFDKLTTVPPNRDGFSYITDSSHVPGGFTISSFPYCSGNKKFISSEEAEKAIPVLGGEPQIKKYLEEGRGKFLQWVLNGEKT